MPLTEQNKSEIIKLIKDKFPNHSHTLDKILHTDLLGVDTDGYHDNKYLNKENTTAFTPDANYEPATKKYVDDGISGGSASTKKDYTSGEGITAGNTIFIADGN